MSKKILLVIGTRPNFIKITRFRSCLASHPEIDLKILHTGQHHDAAMSDIFFSQFGLKPDYYLKLKTEGPAQQIAEMITGLSEAIHSYRPALVIVVGDVNSTLAGSLAANKAGVPLAHLESGLRSFDRTMPEEINRIITDELSSHCFVTEESGRINLLKAGKSESGIYFVGNTMIDTMVAFDKEICASEILNKLGINSSFVLMTVHRPATVDHEPELTKLIYLLESLGAKYQIVFPVHPRTRANLRSLGLEDRFNKIRGLLPTAPLDYFAIQKLIRECAFIITDSGGIQEESTFRQKPCLTLRPNTERPVTVESGSNTLLDFDLIKVTELIGTIEKGTYKKGEIPPLWDGHATERVVEVLSKII